MIIYLFILYKDLPYTEKEDKSTDEPKKRLHTEESEIIFIGPEWLPRLTDIPFHCTLLHSYPITQDLQRPGTVSVTLKPHSHIHFLFLSYLLLFFIPTAVALPHLHLVVPSPVCTQHTCYFLSLPFKIALFSLVIPRRVFDLSLFSWHCLC